MFHETKYSLPATGVILSRVKELLEAMGHSFWEVKLNQILWELNFNSQPGSKTVRPSSVKFHSVPL